MAARGKYQQWLTEEGLLLLEAWARDGLTDEDIAHNCDIHVATLYEWKKKHSEIAEALKKGKEVADIIVENALYKRAVGFHAVDQRTEESEDGYKKVTTIREVAPDTTAAIFWLKNRKPNYWRDRPSAGNDEVWEKLDKVLGDIDAIADK